MSSVIGPDRRQLTLELEPGLTQRFRCARDAVAQGVYQRGLKRIAGDLDMAPGNLSVALDNDGVRHLSLDHFERYLQVTGDLTPLYYLVERYLGDQGAARAEALDRVMRVAEQVHQFLATAVKAGAIVRAVVNGKSLWALPSADVGCRSEPEMNTVFDDEQPDPEAFSACLWADGDLDVFGVVRIEQNGCSGVRLTRDQVAQLMRLLSGLAI